MRSRREHELRAGRLAPERPSAPSRSRARLAAAILLILSASACDRGQQASAPAGPPPAVGVRPAEMKGINQSFEFVGHVQAINKVDVRARIEGFLDKVLFREGQDVKAGDLLYQIEKVQYQAQVEQAQANLAAAQAETTNAQLQYNRALQLVSRQYTPQSVVDQDKAALDSGQAKIMQTKAALTQAQVNLGYTDIRSPIDGQIGRTAYTMGNLVNAASGVLATIVSQDPMYVVFPVSVRELEIIRQARQQDGGLEKIEIRVRLSNGQLYPLPGRWNFTDPQVDRQTDTLILRATIPNPDRLLADGQFVTAIIQGRQQQPRLVIPQAALQLDQSGYYVLVVGADHKVELRRVQTGPESDTDVQIASGLREGENVIVQGLQKVRPGQTVQEAVVSPGAGSE